MTRINLVNPIDLADQHLFAEWREITRIPSALHRSLKTQNISTVLNSIPTRYTLNTGHMKFFYNKMLFLHNRYQQLTQELLSRNYNIRQHDANDIFFRDVPEQFRQVEWQPDIDEIKISIERILLRINDKVHWYKHFSEPVMPGYFEAIYKSYS